MKLFAATGMWLSRSFVIGPHGMKMLLLLIPFFTACRQTPEVNPIRDNKGRIRAEVSRINGRKDGPVRFFDAEGTLTTSGGYTRDSRDGAWVSVDRNGDTLSIVQFDRGRKNGLQAYWATNGQLLRIEQFEEGVPHGALYRFFADGSPRQITWYDHGIPEGPYLEWYKVDSTSVALTLGQFHSGERTGRWTWFYGNGRVNRQGHYKKGKSVGIWRYWNADGKETKRVDRGG